jgi:hypothetical protein
MPGVPGQADKLAWYHVLSLSYEGQLEVSVSVDKMPDIFKVNQVSVE